MKAFSFDSRESTGEPKCMIFELRGYIDAHTVIEFEKAVQQVIEGGNQNIILDISGLSYISSAGIGAMMGLARKLSANKGDLVLLNPSTKVFAILEGLGFTKIFKIASSEDEAVEKMKGSSG
ncbi:MAG: STAS domain-containing protein [Candidatus Sumerlaeaceae bacterium]|nr:STAS domain-containing protein [Candidatus Sumerlaeaceae bacterium]